ncbi:hypothetical protein RHSIM_Rhsim07G0198400 [Rhododendron simsii]|uniref:Uncharacterized protein n=1 Tax=Rhododendron simsii TaxID=118357 RepID=A0A834GKN8_RHOSS|nr:hypothetical protein RHSIM_Rhsim07G0198400 [Rhododendron simsii]
MEDATSKKEVKNRATAIDNTPWYCYLEEAIRVFLRCLGFGNHESTKSGIEENEVVVEDSSSSIISSEKDGENCEVSEQSAVQDSSGSKAGGGGSGATDPAASATDDPDAGYAADSPSTADPAIISLEDTATTAARRSSRPPINAGSGPQTN